MCVGIETDGTVNWLPTSEGHEPATHHRGRRSIVFSSDATTLIALSATPPIGCQLLEPSSYEPVSMPDAPCQVFAKLTGPGHPHAQLPRVDAQVLDAPEINEVKRRVSEVETPLLGVVDDEGPGPPPAGERARRRLPNIQKRLVSEFRDLKGWDHLQALVLRAPIDSIDERSLRMALAADLIDGAKLAQHAAVERLLELIAFRRSDMAAVRTLLGEIVGDLRAALEDGGAPTMRSVTALVYFYCRERELAAGQDAEPGNCLPTLKDSNQQHAFNSSEAQATLTALRDARNASDAGDALRRLLSARIALLGLKADGRVLVETLANAELDADTLRVIGLSSRGAAPLPPAAMRLLSEAILTDATDELDESYSTSGLPSFSLTMGVGVIAGARAPSAAVTQHGWTALGPLVVPLGVAFKSGPWRTELDPFDVGQYLEFEQGTLHLRAAKSLDFVAPSLAVGWQIARTAARLELRSGVSRFVYRDLAPFVGLSLGGGFDLEFCHFHGD